jgi:hypothetical protein
MTDEGFIEHTRGQVLRTKELLFVFNLMKLIIPRNIYMFG